MLLYYCYFDFTVNFVKSLVSRKYLNKNRKCKSQTYLVDFTLYKAAVTFFNFNLSIVNTKYSYLIFSFSLSEVPFFNRYSGT